MIVENQKLTVPSVGYDYFLPLPSVFYDDDHSKTLQNVKKNIFDYFLDDFYICFIKLKPKEILNFKKIPINDFCDFCKFQPWDHFIMTNSKLDLQIISISDFEYTLFSTLNDKNSAICKVIHDLNGPDNIKKIFTDFDGCNSSILNYCLKKSKVF